MTHSGFVLVDGVVAPLEAPVISACDMGFLHGDSLFTTMAVHDGSPVLWDRHAERLEKSLGAFGFSEYPGRDLLLSECCHAIRIQPTPPSVLRLTLSRGRAKSPGLDGISEALVRVILPLFRASRTEAEILAGARVETFRLPWDPEAMPLFCHKTGNLLWAKMIRGMKANPQAVEQLLLSQRGEVLEGTISSVFAVEADGTLVTAPLSCGILPGIMRSEVLSWARSTGRRVREEAPLIEKIGSYRELFLTSSTLPILPVHTLDHSPHPVVFSQDFSVALAFLGHYRSRILSPSPA